MEQTLGTVVMAVVQIFGSQEPEKTLIDAISNGTMPDEVGLDLAENLGELVKVSNLENSLEVVSALSQSGAISTMTTNVILLAIIEMANPSTSPSILKSSGLKGSGQVEEEEGEIEASYEPAEVSHSDPATNIADIIKSAVELQQQFSFAANVPAERLAEIRQNVATLAKEEFSSLRQVLGSAILAQAELTPDQRRVDVAASLQVLDILLGQRQTELTSAIFSVYEALSKEGFRLRDRDGLNRPLMTVSSTSLIRNRFRVWLDSHESGLGATELTASEKAIATLESFLLATAEKQLRKASKERIAPQRIFVEMKERIACENTSRIRERIISSEARILDAIAEEVVAALPQTKEEVLAQADIDLTVTLEQLGSQLRRISSISLTEAREKIEEILLLNSSCAAQRREIAELESSDYDPSSERPEMSAAEKRLAVLDLERKELDSIRADIESEIEESQDSKNSLKKVGILRAIVASKLEELDVLITGGKPASTTGGPPIRQTQTKTSGVSGIPLPPPPPGFHIPPPPPASTAGKKEAAHG